MTSPLSHIDLPEDPLLPHSEIHLDDIDTITLTRFQRWSVFSIISLISLLSNLDNGIVPAATEQIRTDLKIGDSEIGLFGSADYVGRIISSVIFIYIINKVNRQYILAASLFFKAANLALCMFSKNYYLILATRCLCGFSQVYYTIYFPVWCDQFGSKKSSSIMIAIVQIGCPLGIVVGFCLSTITKNV